MRENGSVIQSGGSSRAKKMFVLRTKICDMGLFYDFFICFISVLLLIDYM